MVIATQNPIEHEGTYPLPGVQLDRFLMRVSVGYPSADSELQILDTHGDHDALEDIGPVITAADVRSLSRRGQGDPRRARAEVVPRRPGQRLPPPPAPVPRHVAPRHARPAAGRAGPGGLPTGRTYVVPDDLKALAEPVLAHRLLVTPEAQLQGISAADALDRGAAGRARSPPTRPGEPGLLTRQGWLVGLGAGVLLLAGRVLGLVELFALGVVAAALLAGCALLVVAARLELEVGRSRPSRRVHVGTSSRVELTVRNLRGNGTPVLRLRDPVSGTRGADLLVPPLGTRRAHRGRLPAAHRPTRARRDRAARRSS